VLEKLTHIRNSSRRGNGQGRKLRGRLNRWSFHELQRQIEYKAKWEGVPVEYVWASRTSQTCSQCGFINKALKYERGWLCPICGAILDRDYDAARNILLRSRFKEADLMVRPSNEGLANEGKVRFAAVTRC
jgi:IS605 OrfB family transposase